MQLNEHRSVAAGFPRLPFVAEPVEAAEAGCARGDAEATAVLRKQLRRAQVLALGLNMIDRAC